MSVIDLETNASLLATQLGSFRNFLDATKVLHSSDNLSSANFRRHSRKIITLLEIARKTLAASGVPIYPFLCCPPHAVRFRTAYVELLFMLQRRRKDVSDLLQGRVRQLLMPISPTLVIQSKSKESSSSHRRRTPNRTSHATETHQPVTDPEPNTLARTMPSTAVHTMPPPDAFPKPNLILRRRNPQHISRGRTDRRRLWNVDFWRTPTSDVRRCRRKRRDNDERTNDDTMLKSEQENAADTEASLVVQIPRRQQFGIFCTGKMGKHRFSDAPKYMHIIRTMVPLKE